MSCFFHVERRLFGVRVERPFLVQKKFDFTVDEGKERLNSSRDKNYGKHRRRKVEKSCATFLLCDPVRYVHKSDVQKNWDNTHTHASSKLQTDKAGNKVLLS